MPVDTRRAVRSHERSLDQECSCAAAWIVQRNAGVPGRKLDKRGSQRFAKRCFAVPCTVTATGKSITGSIQQNTCMIIADRNMDRKGST